MWLPKVETYSDNNKKSDQTLNYISQNFFRLTADSNPHQNDIGLYNL